MHHSRSSTRASKCRVRISTFLAAIIIVSCLLSLETSEAQSCQYYAAPNGSGSSCSGVAPCKIGSFWGKAKPGDTLCLRTGTYSGRDDAKIRPPDGLNGSPGKPITIRAEHDGGVLLRSPIVLNGNYFQVKGVDAQGNGEVDIRLKGNHNVIKRVVCIGHPNNREAGIGMNTGQHNLVEDVACIGPARKQISPSSFPVDHHNTIRRFWAVFNHRAPSDSGPGNVIEVGYGQGGMLLENVIALWDQSNSVRARGRTGEPEGLIEAFSSHGSRLLGAIVYTRPGDVYPGSRGVFAIHAKLTDFIADGLLAYIHPDTLRGSSQSEITPLLFVNGVSTATAVDHGTATLHNAIGIGGIGNRIDSHWKTANVQWFPDVRAADSVWTKLPKICKRVVNGQMTNTGLWPWPMDARIVAAHKRPVHGPNGDQAYTDPKELMTVTAQMEQLFGRIPSQCRSGAALPDPVQQPTPAPDDTADQEPPEEDTRPNVPNADLTILDVSSEQPKHFVAEHVLDDDPRTIWHTQFRGDMPDHPHNLVIDLGSERPVRGVTYTPRQDGNRNGTVTSYRIYLRQSSQQPWGGAVAAGAWDGSRKTQQVQFRATTARFVRFETREAVGGRPWASAAELTVLLK